MTPTDIRDTAIPEDVMEAAEFLCQRLEDFERDLEDDEVGRQYYGHVHPAFSRLVKALSRKGAARKRQTDAATDVLAALKRIASIMDFNGTCHPLFKGVQKQMTDAIAKAEGRSHD